MGKLHHAMMSKAAVAIATAAAVPGTLVNLAAGGGDRTSVNFGHPSGTLQVGAEAAEVNGQWTATKAVMISIPRRLHLHPWRCFVSRLNTGYSQVQSSNNPVP